MTKINKVRRYIPLIIILILALNSFIHFGNPPDPIDKKSTKVLFADTLGVRPNADEIKTHNSMLISLLHENMALDVTAFEGRENIKTQNRLFYAAILAALASFLFLKDSPNPMIRRFLLLFIVLMYLLEVHREDLDNRYFVGFDIKGLEVEKLINAKTTTSWYYVTGDSLNAKMAESNKLTNRFPRKLRRAINPDSEQIAFYLIPWAAIYSLALYNRKKRVETVAT
jgi:hypothetical protein